MELLYFLSAILVIWFIKIVWDWVVSVYEMEDEEVSQEEWESLVTKAADDKVDLTFPQS